jgi:hypothetical protein
MQYLTVVLHLLIQSKGIVSTNTLRGGLVHKWVPGHRGGATLAGSSARLSLFALRRPYRLIIRL